MRSIRGELSNKDGVSYKNHKNGVLNMGTKLEKERGNMLAKLSENEQILFEQVYKRHVNAMSSEERKKYRREEITKIEKRVLNKCRNVHFANSEWFRYYVDGTWG